MTISYEDESEAPSTPKIIYEERRKTGKQLLEDRPWGSGVSKLFDQAGGKVTDAVMAATGSPQVAGAAGTLVGVGGPTVLGGGFGKAAAPLLANEGKNLMISALRPTKLDRLSGDAERAAQTMLEEGRNVTKGGVAKLDTKIGDLNDELQTALNSSPATVDKGAIASRLQELISKIETSSYTPQDRVKAVEKIYDQTLGNAVLPSQIPVALANKIKSGIYRELGDLKYKRMRTGDPISDAEQANALLARGTKEDIAAAVPSAEPLNAQMSKLINASNMATNSVSAAAAKSPGGMAWLTHDLPSFLAMVALQHPASKSLLARALYGSDTAVTGLGAATGATVGALKERK